MIEDVVNSDRRPGWRHVADIDSEGIAENPVAVHDRGAELFVDETAPRYPASHIVSLSLPLSVFGVAAYVVVATESFHDQQALIGYVTELCDAFEAKDIDLEPIAIVPHNGSVGTITLDPVRDKDAETIAQSPLADVFCVDRSEIDAKVEFDDIKSNYPALINYVYGLGADVDESDLVDSITSESETYDDISLDVFTVTNEEMRLESDESSDFHETDERT